MKIVKTLINEASSVGRARELFDHFLSYYQGKIVQISGPFITPTEGRSSLPDYIVSGSVIIEDGGNKLNTKTYLDPYNLDEEGVKLNG